MSPSVCRRVGRSVGHNFLIDGEQFEDSLLGPHLSFRRKFSALDHSAILSTPKKVVQSPKAFFCFTSYWMNPMYRVL